MTLYRLIDGIDNWPEWQPLWDKVEKADGAVDGIIPLRDRDYGEMNGDLLVPVEPCEHGKYEGHMLNEGIMCAKRACTNPAHYCPGAGLEDTT